MRWYALVEQLKMKHLPYIAKPGIEINLKSNKAAPSVKPRS